MTEEQRAYLNWLRATGSVNMMAAAPILKQQFPELDTHQAREVLQRWMNTYDPKEDPYR